MAVLDDLSTVVVDSFPGLPVLEFMVPCEADFAAFDEVDFVVRAMLVS